jgi:hypothetical protein
MVPAALGTQVVGSILRPASFCGCVGFKPSVGRINRGGSYDYFSQSCTGVLAASLEDAWLVAVNITARAGGDPGYPGLQGPAEPLRRGDLARWRRCRLPDGRRPRPTPARPSRRRRHGSPQPASRSPTVMPIRSSKRSRGRLRTRRSSPAPSTPGKGAGRSTPIATATPPSSAGRHLNASRWRRP